MSEEIKSRKIEILTMEDLIRKNRNEVEIKKP